MQRVGIALDLLGPGLSAVAIAGRGAMDDATAKGTVEGNYGI